MLAGGGVLEVVMMWKWGYKRDYRRFISFKQLRHEHEHEKVKPSNPHRRMIQLTALEFI